MGKIKIAITVGIAAMTLLSACKVENSSSEKTEYSDCQRGFMGVYGNKIYPSPDGYYFFAGNYLMFIDPALKESTFVCNKAECLHAEEPPENRINCDAFYNGPKSVVYEDGKLYVLSRNMQKKDNSYSIYTTEIDGSDRNVLYTSGNAFSAFCLHRGNIYASEVRLTDEDGKFFKKPMVTLKRFPLKNPKNVTLLLQEENLKNGDINNLNCYQNNCYCDVVDFFDLSVTSKKVNADTGAVSAVTSIDANLRGIGKDILLYEEIADENFTPKQQTWKSRYWESDLEGGNLRELTKEDFSVIEKNATLLSADENYVYFYDAMQGENALYAEQRFLYIYSYDGKLICKVPIGEMPYMIDFYSGDGRYCFICQLFSDEESGDTQFSIHYLDKRNLNENSRFKTMFEGSYSYYCGAVVY